MFSSSVVDGLGTGSRISTSLVETDHAELCRHIYSVGVGGILKIVVVQICFEPLLSTGWERAAALVQALLRPTMDRLVVHI